MWALSIKPTCAIVGVWCLKLVDLSVIGDGPEMKEHSYDVNFKVRTVESAEKTSKLAAAHQFNSGVVAMISLQAKACQIMLTHTQCICACNIIL